MCLRNFGTLVTNLHLLEDGRLARLSRPQEQELNLLLLLLEGRRICRFHFLRLMRTDGHT